MKGQVTFINLLAIVVTIIVYMALLPVINNFIDNTVVDLEASPNEYTTIQVALLYLTPFLILLMIILSGLNMAIPRREGFGGGGYAY